METKLDKDSVVSKLRKNIETLESEKTALTDKINNVELSFKTLESIPHEYNNLKKHELKAIAEANGVTIKNENGKLVPYKNGEIWRDEKSQAPLEVKDAYKKFFEEEKGMKVDTQNTPPSPDRTGRGAGNQTPSGSGRSLKRSEIIKQWQDANPNGNIAGYEFQSHLATQIKAAKDAGQAIEMD